MGDGRKKRAKRNGEREGGREDGARLPHWRSKLCYWRVRECVGVSPRTSERDAILGKHNLATFGSKISHSGAEICQGLFLPIAIFAIECCEAGEEDRRPAER